MDDYTYDEKRGSPRIESALPVEFVIDANTVDGVTADASSTGIRLTTPTPLDVKLQTGPDEIRPATLVWACQRDDGSCMYGFKYAGT